MKKVAILMATYNGEKFIKEQLDSIVNQTYSNWVLLIRDDCSKDTTISILNNYKNKYSNIYLLADENKNVGQCKNFSILLNHVPEDCEYIMFADQDDIWLENKIEKSVFEMEKINFNGPLVGYTNYFNQTYGEEKKTVAYNKNMDEITKASRLLVQNWVMGCTMVINRQLLEICKDIPSCVDNHDNWIANLAILRGKVIYYGVPTMIHIIHSDNVTTSKETTKLGARLKRFVLFNKNKKEFLSKKIAFLNELKARMERKSDILEKFIGMLNAPKLYRPFICIKNQFYAFTFHQTVLFFSLLL